MRDLNICLINDSFPPEIDGVANAVTNYAGIISRDFGRATVVTPKHPQADDGAYPFPVLRYPSVDMTRFVGYRAGFPFAPDIQKRLEAEHFDLIHSHCPITSTMFARSLRYAMDVPVVLTYHTKFDIDIANAIGSRLLQDEAKRLLVQNISACDEVWTVSRGAGENLRALGFEGGYTVMPNGVDFPRGRVSEALIESVTAGYDLPQGLPLFLFVGRMMWYKGLRLILDALKLLRESGRDFRMVFVGAGNDKDEVEAYSDSLGLSDRVFFSPPIRDREQIRAWYCRSDVFLFPSTFDTNGLVVREAAACALGSVLVAGSCAAEDVTDGVSGWLIDENAEAMAAKLRELCAAPESMAQVGEGAQRELYMSWDASVARACEAYAVVIDNYKRGLYPARERVSDEMFRASSQMMDAIARSRDKQRSRRDGLMSGYMEMRQEIKTRQEQVKDKLEAGQEKIKDRLEELVHDRFL